MKLLILKTEATPWMPPTWQSLLAPAIRCWLKDEATEAMVELPGVQMLEEPHALLRSGQRGVYRVMFENGIYICNDDEVELLGPTVLEGEITGSRLTHRLQSAHRELSSPREDT